MLKKLSSLKIRFAVITLFTYLLLVNVILLACYFRFYRNMIASYESLGSEVLSLASDDINIDAIPEYLSGEYDAAEYAGTQKKLDSFAQYFTEIRYLYAYQVKDDGAAATVIFDADTHRGEEPDRLGDSYVLEEEVVRHIDEFRNGLPVRPIMDKTEWGYLLTCAQPLIDSEGVCRGYLLVDFDLTDARAENLQFIVSLFLTVFSIMFVIFYLGMSVVARRITRPIEKMYLCLSSFKYTSDKDRKENIERLKSLDIHTNAEIQSLYDALVAATEDSYRYMQEYQATAQELSVANVKAYSDALTGLYNKNAYEDKLKGIQEQVDARAPLELAIMMVDVNNLKYVNDTFGHERGDEYINGCCGAIEALCTHSSVYRIGGDEFVVILEKDDYTNRKTICEKLTASFDASYRDTTKQPWERYSASVGIADCRPEDVSISEVFKRADRSMYEAKTKFKEKYGSYR